MKYTEGTIGRVFALTFEHGDLFIERLVEFVREKNVRNAYIFMLGAMETGRIVTGPKDLTLPAAPVWSEFSDGRELLGAGSVMWAEGAPKPHIHIAAGRGGETLLGCLREGGKVHIVVEAVLFEVDFGGLEKVHDAGIGAFLPDHKK